MSQVAPDNAAPKALNPSLGTYCQDCVHTGKQTQQANEQSWQSETVSERQWRLQDVAARLLPNSKTAKCFRTIAPGHTGVSVCADDSHAFYRHLLTCDRVWTCPVCAPKITNKRRDEISRALIKAFQLGWTPVLLTFTLRHGRGDALEKVLGALLESIRAFTAGREFQEIKLEYGWRGWIRSLETTTTENGWHPHCHALAFIAPTDEDGKLVQVGAAGVGGLAKWLKERWRGVVKKQGFSASIEHGLDVTAADEDIAEYVSKFGKEPEDAGWGAADEVTRNPAKVAFRNGITPFMLLHLASLPANSPEFEKFAQVVSSPEQAAALFIEYAGVFEGRNQLVWSRGLKDLLLSDELEPEESEATSEAEEIAYLEPEVWKRVLKAGARRELLTVAATKDRAKFRDYMRDRFGVVYVDLSGL